MNDVRHRLAPRPLGMAVLLLALPMAAEPAVSRTAHGSVPADEAQDRGARAPSCDTARGDAPATADRDADGLSDGCELELARAFAPVLVVRAAGCNLDESVLPARLGGGYLHAVQRAGASVRVAYLPAYFRDCGWRGAKCWLPRVDCSPHDGDSELIVVEASLDTTTGAWHPRAVFLSAHCFTGSAQGCRWYVGEELERFAWEGAAPVVWVAEGRHANYPDRRACDRGHYGLDTCDRHDARVRFPVASERNIGSASRPRHPAGCIPRRALESAMVDPSAEECVWRPGARFRGWQPDAGEGVTGYRRYLDEVAEFGILEGPTS